MTLPDIYVPAGSSGHGNFTVDIDPQRAGWAFSGLRVLVLEAGASQVVETGEAELLVLPLGRLHPFRILQIHSLCSEFRGKGRKKRKNRQPRGGGGNKRNRARNNRDAGVQRNAFF